MTTTVEQFSNDIKAFYQEVSTSFDSQIKDGSNAAIQQYIQTQTDYMAKGYLTVAEKSKLQAMKAEASFVVYAEKARKWAAKAEAAGNTFAKDMWTKTANGYDDFVQKYSTMNATEYGSYVKNTMKANFASFVKKSVKFGGIAFTVIDAYNAVVDKNWNKLGEVSVGFLTGVGVAAVTATLSLGIVTTVATVGISVALAEILWTLTPIDEFGKWLGGKIYDLVNGNFIAAENWRAPIDPLAFDLDGDGIETIAVNGNAGVLFDHEGNGVKTATGWIAPDDGFLVYDRNGNGVIDNGTELFGDNTALNAGGTAANGFEALADFDTNGDGVVDVNDANFSGLRIWQDINSDGISQADELLTLAQAGVASINTGYENSSIVQNGNVISGIGSYTRTDGTSSSIASATSLANLDLATSSFYSAFTDSIPLTTEAALLPTMNGSGMVRNMREAASLSTGFSNILTGYSNATTAVGQKALLDGLISKWSETSTMSTMVDTALAARYLPVFTFGTVASSTVDESSLKATYEGTNVGTANDLFDLYNAAQAPAYTEWLNKLSVLERFMGRDFIQFIEPLTAPPTLLSVIDPTSGALVNYYKININITQPRLDLLEQSYQALKDSVYDSLLPQTRLKPYYDGIGLVADSTGFVTVDFSAMETGLTQAISLNAVNGISALIDLLSINAESFKTMGWSSWGYLGNVLETVTQTPEIINLLAQQNIIYAGFESAGAVTGTDAADKLIGTTLSDILNGGNGNDIIDGNAGDDVISGGRGADTLYGSGGNDTINGNEASDILYGDAGNDILNGDSGNDTLDGGAGNDTLDGGAGLDQMYGGAGDDILGSKTGADNTGYFYDSSTATYRGNDYTGGTGNDTLNGSKYADVYYFNVGDGMDTIDETGGYSSYDDKIILGAGILTSDVSLTHDGTDLLINFSNGTDQIRVSSWYVNTANRVESLAFADGTVWDVNALHAGGLVLNGSALDDTLQGLSNQDDVIYGLAGNDTINGDSGNDILDGGTGNDILDGGAGFDQLYGGAGDDILGSKTGADNTGYFYDSSTATYRGNDYTGGTGNDTLNGSKYADVYYFNVGDGMDTIDETGGYSSYDDKIVLGLGMETNSLVFGRVNDDLVMNVVGTQNGISVQDWYLSGSNQVESIELSNGLSISNSNLDLLIQEMSTFSVANGVSWEQGLIQNPDEVQLILQQYWQVSAQP